MNWAVVLLTLALAWKMVQRGVLPLQTAACRRLGIGFDAIGEVLGQWSLGLLAIGALPLAVRIIAAVAVPTIGLIDTLPDISRIEWWIGVAAILIFAANLDLTRRTNGFDDWIVPHATALMLLWWVAVPASPPMVRLRLDPAVVLPTATVAYALIAAAIGIRSRSRAVAHFGAILSLVAVALTVGRPSPATTATLFLALTVQTWVGVSLKRREMTGLGSTLAMIALGYASWMVSLRFGWDGSPIVFTSFAVGQTIGAIGLIAAGRADRRRGSGLTPIFEGFGLLGLLLAALGVVWPTILNFGEVAPRQALVNVGVMFAVGSLCVVMASRLSSVLLAFAAQTAIVLGYAAFRSGLALPAGWDATAMLLLAGIDLGIAEIAGRGRGRLFALPALMTGLALPLVSVGLALAHGPVGGESLFVLFAAGTFYAAACGRMRWKALGYAAAVLYNAAPLGLVERIRPAPGRGPGTFPRAGRVLDDPFRRGQPPRTGTERRERD